MRNGQTKLHINSIDQKESVRLNVHGKFIARSHVLSRGHFPSQPFETPVGSSTNGKSLWKL